MAVQEIPVAAEVPDQKLSVQLEMETFELRARWNDRAKTWFLDISDAEGVIASARPVMVGTPLFHQLSDRRLPKGELLAIDTSGKDVEAGLGDIGDRVKLYYIESTT